VITGIRIHPGFDYRIVQEITLRPAMKFAELTNKVEKEIKLTNKEAALIQSNRDFEEFMRNSCYHLELDAPKKSTVNAIFVLHGTDFLLILYGLQLAIVYLLLFHCQIIWYYAICIYLFVSSWPVNNETAVIFPSENILCFFASFLVQVAAFYFVLLISV
jgi:hypothetical protein